MNLLKLNVVPLVLAVAGILVAILPSLNQARWDRITDEGVTVPGKIKRGSVTDVRRSSNDKYELEVSYAVEQGERTFQTFQVPEDFYAIHMPAKQSFSVPGESRSTVSVRFNPDDPKEAWIVGAEPGEPLSPFLSMSAGALLLGGGVWYFLSLKSRSKLFQEADWKGTFRTILRKFGGA